VSFGVLHLSSALDDFVAANPAVTFDVGLTDQFVDVVAEGCDLAVRIGQLSDSSLVARRLAPCRMVVCASPEYLQRHGTPKSPEALAQHDCLSYTAAAGPGRWRFVRKKRAHIVQVTSGIVANNMDLLRVLAVRGRGIVLGPTFVLGADLAAGRLVPLLDGYELPELIIHAIYPPSRNVPAKVRALVDFLSTLFGPEPSWDRWRHRA
jgi:DNA-binding transcriptional LysR family regulator